MELSDVTTPDFIGAEGEDLAHLVAVEAHHRHVAATVIVGWLAGRGPGPRILGAVVRLLVEVDQGAEVDLLFLLARVEPLGGADEAEAALVEAEEALVTWFQGLLLSLLRGLFPGIPDPRPVAVGKRPPHAAEGALLAELLDLLERPEEAGGRVAPGTFPGGGGVVAAQRHPGPGDIEDVVGLAGEIRAGSRRPESLRGLDAVEPQHLDRLLRESGPFDLHRAAHVQGDLAGLVQRDADHHPVGDTGQLGRAVGSWEDRLAVGGLNRLDGAGHEVGEQVAPGPDVRHPPGGRDELVDWPDTEGEEGVVGAHQRASSATWEVKKSRNRVTTSSCAALGVARGWRRSSHRSWLVLRRKRSSEAAGMSRAGK